MNSINIFPCNLSRFFFHHESFDMLELEFACFVSWAVEGLVATFSNKFARLKTQETMKNEQFDFFDACRKGNVETITVMYNNDPQIINIADTRGFQVAALITAGRSIPITRNLDITLS